MGKVIPREQLGAMKPMKLAAFDRPATAQPSFPSSPTSSKSIPVAVPASEDIEAELRTLREAARQEGFRAGEEAGRQIGFEAGLTAAQEQQTRLAALLAEMDNTRLRKDEAIANEVLELALTVARHIVRGVIDTRPQVILEAIREAMLALPSLEMNYRVISHPADAERVRDWVEREHSHLGWEVMEDPQMMQGGFRIDSAHSELDASLPTRWQQVLEGLGADPSWLETNG